MRNNHTNCLDAAEHGDLATIESNLNNFNINVKNAAGENGLMLAIKGGHAAIISLYMSHPHSRLDDRNNDGETALMYAVKHNNFNIVKELLDKP